MSKKIDKLVSFLSKFELQPDLILLTETKITKQRDLVVNINIPGYVFIQNDTSSNAKELLNTSKTISTVILIVVSLSKYLELKLYG